jgi:predicted nucleic acid-binding Zn ribbon protein
MGNLTMYSAKFACAMCGAEIPSQRNTCESRKCSSKLPLSRVRSKCVRSSSLGGIQSAVIMESMSLRISQQHELPATDLPTSAQHVSHSLTSKCIAHKHPQEDAITASKSATEYQARKVNLRHRLSFLFKSPPVCSSLARCSSLAVTGINEDRVYQSIASSDILTRQRRWFLRWHAII